VNRKRAAVFTKVKNGHELFKIWYRYYLKYFSEDDIYVLDLGSTDGSTSDLGCNVIPLSHFGVERWRAGGLDAVIGCDIGNKFKTELLQKYQYVVHSDYDELIYHPLGLDKYLMQLSIDAVSCQGQEIIHIIDKEAPIDFTKPILDQRSYSLNWVLFDKPAITSVDFTWGRGFHSIIDRPNPPVGNQLILFHLHNVDFTLAKNLNMANIIRYLIDNNRYTGIYSNGKPLSKEELDKKTSELKKYAIIKDPIILHKSPNTISPFLGIGLTKIYLWYSDSNCDSCLFGPCFFEDGEHGGNQNFYLEKRLAEWWKLFSEHELLTTIPEYIKEEQPF